MPATVVCAGDQKSIVERAHGPVDEDHACQPTGVHYLQGLWHGRDRVVDGIQGAAQPFLDGAPILMQFSCAFANMVCGMVRIDKDVANCPKFPNFSL